MHRLRVLWGELCGYGEPYGRDWISRAQACHDLIRGAIVTDSKGCHVSVLISESANLGLANARAAVQPYAVR